MTDDPAGPVIDPPGSSRAEQPPPYQWIVGTAMNPRAAPRGSIADLRLGEHQLDAAPRRQPRSLGRLWLLLGVGRTTTGSDQLLGASRTLLRAARRPPSAAARGGAGLDRRLRCGDRRVAGRGDAAVRIARATSSGRRSAWSGDSGWRERGTPSRSPIRCESQAE